jgi:threonine 3-dehydrogenase
MAKIILGQRVRVFITDVMPYRLKLAEQFGGVPINVKDASLAVKLKAEGTEHPDMAIDTSGKQGAREDALRSLGPRGSLICVGHGEGMNLEISPDLVNLERGVMGSAYFRYDEFPANLRRLRQHRTYLNQIITHRLGVDDIQYAFELFFQGETGKVVIEQ